MPDVNFGLVSFLELIADNKVRQSHMIQWCKIHGCHRIFGFVDLESVARLASIPFPLLQCC